MLKTVQDRASTDAARDAETQPPIDPLKGTAALPLASNSRMVAGMPRHGRAIEEPGDPGVPSPEEDVLDIRYDQQGP